MPASISVAIKNSIIREGLRRILTDSSFDVTESVSSLEDLQLIFNSDPEHHLLVVERDLLHQDFEENLEALRRGHHAVRIVVLTSAFDFDEMIAVYTAGAYAYFPDHVPYLSLVAVLQMVSSGQKVAPHEAVDFLVNMPAASLRAVDSSAAEAYNFRERELRVLEFLALGQPNKAISRELGINESAVKAAVKAILRKLGVENRTQAAVMARELISKYPPPRQVAGG
ncbi:MAG TPA: response regulator transcription factor [Novosphingobium sp.]|nr:response regulator transcription factor [Novosphingobium sp.]